MNPTTDLFGNKVSNTGWTVPQQTTDTGTVRKPGNFLTHLLPAVGGTLGAIIGTPADLISGIGGTVAGGAGGSAIGKLLENKIEHQSLGSGVGSQALIGGASGLGGELLGGAFDAVKGAGQAGADVAENAVGDTAANAGRQNIGERLAQSVRGLSPEDLAGNTVTNVPEAARLNQVAESLPLRGSSTQQLNQLSKLFQQSGDELGTALKGSTNTTSLENINQAIDNAIGAHPLNPAGSTAGLSDNELFAQRGALENPATTQFQQSGQTIKNVAAKMAQDNGGNFSDSDVNQLRQQVDKLVNFNASPNASPDIMNEAARASRGALNDIIAENNPEARGLISKQSDMIKLGDALGKQSGYARAGVRIGGVRVPINVGSALESAQAGVSTLLGAGNNAERLIPAAAQGIGQAVGNKVQGNIQQGEAQQGLQGANTDLTTPGSDLAKQLQGYLPSNTQTVNGLPSADRIKQLELQDLETTGGKNYTMLSRLGTIASTQEQQQVLSPTAEKGVTTYQQQLGVLQNIANAFQGNGNFNDVANLMSQSLPDLQKATGLSAKQVTAALPNASDRADIAIQKLQSLKTLIDAKASDTLSATQSNQDSSQSSSFLNSLLAGANT